MSERVYSTEDGDLRKRGDEQPSAAQTLAIWSRRECLD